MSDAKPPAKWAIEDSFPIVEINRLAVPERNAFKPIYQMHKWFARRSSCVFRAILLGSLTPLPAEENGKPAKGGAQVIMDAFYRNHTDDPNTKGKVVLDPFMGGGVTPVEALRLGSKVIGIDLNPVAWFIVKTEVEAVDPEALKRSFEGLANRIVPWSGKPLKETILSLYKTKCPCCGNLDADIIYTFWVKSAICTNPTCKKQVPLFSDYVIASRQPSIKCHQDAACPKCKKNFDWELEPASLIAETPLTVVNSQDGAGIGRGNRRWAFAKKEPVGCPWCNEQVKPKLVPGKTKPVRKKVPLTVLLCPHCQVVWQYRGTVPEKVACPSCKHDYNPSKGNTAETGKFVCPECGGKDQVIRSIRSLPDHELLPTAQYAIEGYCPRCHESGAEEDSQDPYEAGLGAVGEIRTPEKGRQHPHNCCLSKNKGKFFKRVEPTDLELFLKSARTWEQNEVRLPYPKSKIPVGNKTKSGLLSHHYLHWHQMFTPRQLLSLATVLEAIGGERDAVMQEMHLTTFETLIERNNMFCRYFNDRDTVQGCFARHDFQPKMTPAESNVWGRKEWRGTVPNLFERTLVGKRYNLDAFDYGMGEGTQPVSWGEKVEGETVLSAEDSRIAEVINTQTADAVITDPPYAGNVNYAELSDLFYVWLRLILKDRYPAFAPEHTPKVNEIVENPTRGITMEDFTQGLTSVFERCAGAVKDDGLLVFTFHHADTKAWEAVLKSICQAGFELVAAYPVHGEKETSAQLMDSAGISYDLIHVCRKKTGDASEQRAWASIRQEVRRLARREIEMIEAGRYGNEPLNPADVNIILIGKCLELYSRHYGHVVDHAGRPVHLHEALEAIRMEVDQLVSRQQPLPEALAEIDPVSYIYLVCLAERVMEIKSDELHKFTRGVIEPDELLEAGLIIKGRTGRGRYYKIKSPAERFNDLHARFAHTGPTVSALPGLEDAVSQVTSKGVTFIDHVHFLIGLAEGNENLLPWMEEFRGMTPAIRAACEYLRQRQPRFAPACEKILRFIEVTPLFK